MPCKFCVISDNIIENLGEAWGRKLKSPFILELTEVAYWIFPSLEFSWLPSFLQATPTCSCFSPWVAPQLLVLLDCLLCICISYPSSPPPPWRLCLPSCPELRIQIMNTSDHSTSTWVSPLSLKTLELLAFLFLGLPSCLPIYRSPPSPSCPSVCPSFSDPSSVFTAPQHLPDLFPRPGPVGPPANRHHFPVPRPASVLPNKDENANVSSACLWVSWSRASSMAPSCRSSPLYSEPSLCTEEGHPECFVLF